MSLSLVRIYHRRNGKSRVLILLSTKNRGNAGDVQSTREVSISEKRVAMCQIECLLYSNNR